MVYRVKSRVFRPVSSLFLLVSSCFLLACNSQNVQQTQSGQCPQTRSTEMAPALSASQSNPLVVNAENIDAGEKLYRKSAKPVACVECHGESGDGNGRMANMFEPAPRNFTCTEVIAGLPDGQLFWIIKNGSIGTSMPAFNDLSDDQIWQLTMYLRSFEIKTDKTSSANAKVVKTDRAAY